MERAVQLTELQRAEKAKSMLQHQQSTDQQDLLKKRERLKSNQRELLV
jgi:hypothetical protein